MSVSILSLRNRQGGQTSVDLEVAGFNESPRETPLADILNAKLLNLKTGQEDQSISAVTPQLIQLKATVDFNLLNDLAEHSACARDQAGVLRCRLVVSLSDPNEPNMPPLEEKVLISINDQGAGVPVIEHFFYPEVAEVGEAPEIRGRVTSLGYGSNGFAGTKICMVARLGRTIRTQDVTLSASGRFSYVFAPPSVGDWNVESRFVASAIPCIDSDQYLASTADQPALSSNFAGKSGQVDP